MRDILEESFEDEYTKYQPKLWINPNYWQRKLIKAKTIIYWLYLPSNPQKGAKVIDRLFKKYYEMADADFNWTKEPGEISPRFRLNFTYLIENLVVDSSADLNYRFHDIYIRVTADNQASRIIVALRKYQNKHGRWPETLDQIKSFAPEEILVDPINGSSFVGGILCLRRNRRSSPPQG